MAKDITTIAKDLMRRPERIRNIGIVAHIDHGKTTLSDNLLAGAGMISEEHAGQQLFMDSDEQEQERGITIFAANVSMIHEWEGKDYLINMIDTPGHVDFGGDVTRAMRAVDGVVAVACAVEGCMPQTETVLRQALKERVRPTLFINKVDRLIKELRLTPEQMSERLMKIIKNVNNLIAKFAEDQYKEKWMVSVNDGSVAFGSAVKNWAISIPIMKKTGISFKDIIDMTMNDQEKELAKKAPLHRVVLDMAIQHLPNPKQSQAYRIPKLWPGDMTLQIATDMQNANPDGKLAAIITKMYPDPHAGYVATTRIFSGKIVRGQEVYLVSQHKGERVQQVAIYKGQQRIPMDEVVAGNIVGLVGLRDAGSGETLCEPDTPIEGFEAIKHMFEPVVVKAIEPKNPKQLSKLITFLKKLSREDPTLRITIKEETGEYLVAGLGELHINAKVEVPLKKEGIEAIISPPIVIFKEGIRNRSSEVVEGKSPNKHNRFYVITEPIPEKVMQAMMNGDIKDQDIKKKDQALIDKLVDLGMNRDEVKKIKDIYNKNMLFDNTTGVTSILEIMEMVKQAFHEACDQGPLAREPVTGVVVRLVDAKLHEDAIHRGPAQVIPAIRRAVKDAMLKSKPFIYEPKQVIRIDVPSDHMGGATKEISNKRGQILEMSEELGTTQIKTKVPVAEMFAFNSDLKSSTGGTGFYWLIDVVYEPLPKELEMKVINQIKTRKGISDKEEEEDTEE